MSVCTYEKNGVDTDGMSAALPPKQKSAAEDDGIRINRKFSVHSGDATDHA